MSKIVVAITGGSGVGKTTQCKMLVDFLTEGGKDKPYVVSQELSKDKLEYCYTVYPKAGLAVIGKLGANQCTGLDSVYSKLGAVGVCRTMEQALKDDSVGIIMIECLFFTYSWYENWEKAGLRGLFKFLFIHLDMSLFENLRRIQKRRHKKNPEQCEDWRDVFLQDTVFEHIPGKNRETKVIYQKILGEHPKNKEKKADICCQIDATLHQDLIFNKIINEIGKI